MERVNGKHRSEFGTRLRSELDRQGISIRQLSRRIDPQNPELARRNLSRWIAGTKPTRSSRALVANSLGIDSSYFDVDDDEEEAELMRELMAVIRQIVRHEAVPA